MIVNMRRLNLKSLHIILNARGNYVNRTVILCGAGPSLKQSLPLIDPHKVMVVCVDAALPALTKAGIRPHWVMTLDAKRMVAWFWQGTDTSKLKLLAPIFAHPETLKMWKGKILFFATLGIGQDLGFPNIAPNYNVGSTFLNLLFYLNFKHIIMTGIDFSWKDSYYAVGKDIYPQQEESFPIDLPDGTQVMSNSIMVLYAESLDKQLREFKTMNKLNIINTSCPFLKQTPMRDFKEVYNEIVGGV